MLHSFIASIDKQTKTPQNHRHVEDDRVLLISLELAYISLCKTLFIYFRIVFSNIQGSSFL